MKFESPLVIGLGDALLKYPELLGDYDRRERLLPQQPYVAVHLGASTANKIPPDPHLLLEKLLWANVHFVLVGTEAHDLPPNLRLHIDVVKRARKFIGTMSAFNCVAQIMEIPSFVLVNRSIKEPLIERYMQANLSVVEPWNTGRPIGQVYQDAVDWAKL